MESSSGDSSYAKGDDCVSSADDEGEKTGVPSILVSNRVTSQEYDTPIVALLEGNNSMRVALTKKKNMAEPTTGNNCMKKKVGK